MSEESTLSELAMVLAARVEEEGLSNAKLSLQSANGLIWTVRIDAVIVSSDDTVVGKN